MPTLQIGLEQLIELARQLAPEERLRLRRALDEDTDAWWEQTLEASEARLRQLCAERGLEWDALSDEERIEFIDALIHEDRPCVP
ncbi:MAG: hypothetical protein NZ556_00860 [Fimbriimonadales bacterium]|nr:hypothetical protein [Fimbriimonadales bacterium]